MTSKRRRDVSVGLRYYTPFTQGLRPLCLPCTTTKLTRSPLKAERRPNGCLGRSRVYTERSASPWTPWSPWSFEHAQNSRRGGRSLTGRSKEAGGRHTHRRGRRMDVQWSAIARTVGPTNGVHWAITVTLEPPWQWFRLHSASFARPVVPSRKAQGSCCSSYTETELSGLGRPLSVLTIFLVAQRWHEGRSPV